MHNEREDEQLSEVHEAELGQTLRQSMRRVEAPEGFAAGVLARLPEGRFGVIYPRRQPWPIWKSARPAYAGDTRTRIAAIAALLLLVLLPLGGYVHERQQVREAEAAARQFSFAMRLTQEALLAAGEHVTERARSSAR